MGLYIINTWQSKSEIEVNANNDWLIELQSKSKDTNT